MSFHWRLAFTLGLLVLTTHPTPVAAQAPPSPSLDSLQRTLLNAATDSAAGVVMGEGLFVMQSSNQFGDSLLAMAASAQNYRVVVFASLALIPYHNPRSVPPLIRRALLPETSPTERYYLLNASAYILGIGDALLLGRGGDLDSATIQTARGLLELSLIHI